jgi:dTDP-4-dehydrorhamnose reductase
MKILLFGGSGLLGRELLALRPDIVAPTRQEADVCSLEAVCACVKAHAPDVVIHAAAVTDNRYVERAPEAAIQANIIGTAHVALACLREQARLVYLSTDYVYRGDRGGYRETDDVLPFNDYAWSKLGGESAVMLVDNHLIIRTSFGPSAFPYPKAFIDKWFSKDYVDAAARKILEAATSPLTGVLNLGGERRSVYEFATERTTGVTPVRLGEAAFDTPMDTSLNQDKWNEYVSGRYPARARTDCRICGSRELHRYLDLGLKPLPNQLPSTAPEARAQGRYPLQVMFCAACGQSQLSMVVDPRVMYSYYTYRSSISKTFHRHCREMAQDLADRLAVRPSDLVIDIAGNDGTLLLAFGEVLPIRPLNVDPAANIAAIARGRGVPVVNDFWSEEVARQIAAEHGRARVITATNVFAHVDDVRAFLRGVKIALAEDGLFVVEFPYLVDLIRRREYDTVYFEHLSYYMVSPLRRLIVSEGLQLRRITRQAIHGGTIRLEIGHAGGVEDRSVADLMAAEAAEGFLDAGIYRRWGIQIRDLIKDIRSNLVDLKRRGSRIAAFAASAKGNTLLNACAMSTDIVDYIVDDTPEKIGKYSPGNGIPIVGRSVLEVEPPDYLLILSWNFTEEIIASLPHYRGRFVIPIPTFSILPPAGTSGAMTSVTPGDPAAPKR